MLLKHKNTDIAILQKDTDGIVRLRKTLMPDYMPAGTQGRNGSLQDARFRHWMYNRMIPQERQGIRRIKKAAGCPMPVLPFR